MNAEHVPRFNVPAREEMLYRLHMLLLSTQKVHPGHELLFFFFMDDIAFKQRHTSNLPPESSQVITFRPILLSSPRRWLWADGWLHIN